MDMSRWICTLFALAYVYLYSRYLTVAHCLLLFGSFSSSLHSLTSSKDRTPCKILPKALTIPSTYFPSSTQSTTFTPFAFFPSHTFFNPFHISHPSNFNPNFYSSTHSAPNQTLPPTFIRHTTYLIHNSTHHHGSHPSLIYSTAIRTNRADLPPLPPTPPFFLLLSKSKKE